MMRQTSYARRRRNKTNKDIFLSGDTGCLSRSGSLIKIAQEPIFTRR